jgi:hypothetical protein
VITNKLAEGKLERMRHPAHSHDISACHFFLFGYFKDKLIGGQSLTPEELLSQVQTIISTIPSDVISGVFATGQERLQQRYGMRTSYIE